MPLFRFPGLLGAATDNSGYPLLGSLLEDLAAALGEFQFKALPPCPGPACIAKIAQQNPAAKTTTTIGQQLDGRSERIVGELLAEVQPLARALVINSAAAGITIKIISGLRSYEEQDKLFAQGRTAPGKVVTKAPAGYSNHNFGIAFDIGVFQGKKYLPESPSYKTVGAIGVNLGLAWGGNWKSFEDLPHFELHPDWAKKLTENELLEELRKRKSAGKTAFTA